jgi:hypothetical protein
MKAELEAKNVNAEDVGNDWERQSAMFTVVAFRTGWPGAWDAIKAAWRKDTRLQMPLDLTVSAYYRIQEDAAFLQFGAQVETSKT